MRNFPLVLVKYCFSDHYRPGFVPHRNSVLWLLLKQRPWRPSSPRAQSVHRKQLKTVNKRTAGAEEWRTGPAAVTSDLIKSNILHLLLSVRQEVKAGKQVAVQSCNRINFHFSRGRNRSNKLKQVNAVTQKFLSVIPQKDKFTLAYKANLATDAHHNTDVCLAVVFNIKPQPQILLLLLCQCKRENNTNLMVMSRNTEIHRGTVEIQKCNCYLPAAEKEKMLIKHFLLLLRVPSFQLIMWINWQDTGRRGSNYRPQNPHAFNLPWRRGYEVKEKENRSASAGGWFSLILPRCLLFSLSSRGEGGQKKNLL